MTDTPRCEPLKPPPNMYTNHKPAPVTPPAVVAGLVEALEDIVREQQSEAQAGTGEYQRGYDDCIAAHADAARAALAAYREAGR